MGQVISLKYWSALYAMTLNLLNQPGGQPIDTTRIQKFYIRQQAPLVATQNSYNLQLDAGGTAGSNFAQLLPQNDAFIVGGLSMAVMKKKGTAAITTYQLADGQRYTWPNPSIFTFAGAVGTIPEVDAVAGLYNGNMNLKVNNDLALSQFSCQQFLSYQPGSGANQGSTPDDEANEYRLLPAPIILMGKDTITAQFNFVNTLTNIAGDPLGNGANSLDFALVGYRIVDGARSIVANTPLNFQNRR